MMYNPGPFQTGLAKGPSLFSLSRTKVAVYSAPIKNTRAAMKTQTRMTTTAPAAP